jgi:nickel superoxide dismutase
MRHIVSAIVSVAIILAAAGTAGAHCQIPCGIYNDELRVDLVEEHITTIEKAMNQIEILGKASPPNHNQLARWIVNKEKHAQEIQDIATFYFMIQRVKVPTEMKGEAWDDYVELLTLLHKIQVTAMKTKQTADLAHVETLRALVKAFRAAYFGEENGHEH